MEVCSPGICLPLTKTRQRDDGVKRSGEGLQYSVILAQLPVMSKKAARIGGVNKRYTIPIFPVDLLGTVMLNTLERFAFADGWITKRQFLDDLAVATWENPVPGTRLNVRLLRYTRSGLLQRRRTRGRYEYEYRLAHKGLDPYVFMLKSKGMLDPTNARTDEEKEMMLNRIRICRLLRLKQREDLMAKPHKSGNTTLIA